MSAIIREVNGYLLEFILSYDSQEIEIYLRNPGYMQYIETLYIGNRILSYGETIEDIYEEYKNNKESNPN